LVEGDKYNEDDTRGLVCCNVAVMFAYEQCLLCLGHHPDVWIEAAAYLEQASKLLSEKGVCFSRVDIAANVMQSLG